MLKRFELTQTQWEQIESLLPGKPGDRGRAGKDNRQFVNGVLWVLRSGADWRDLPERYGEWHTTHKRFTRWEKAGVWKVIFEHLTSDLVNPYLKLDTRLARAHRQAATQKRRPRIRLWGIPEEH